MGSFLLAIKQLLRAEVRLGELRAFFFFNFTMKVLSLVHG